MTPIPSRRSSTALLLLLAACGGGDGGRVEPMWKGPAAPGHRTFVDVEWDAAWIVGGSDRVVLARPRHLTAVGSGFVWWDDYDHALQAASAEGEILWRFGREGEGPGEFLDVGDVAVDARGDVVLLDTDVRRITRLASDGTVLGQLRLPEGYWRSVSPQPDGSWILAGLDAEHPFVHVDTTGTVMSRLPSPWPGFPGLSVVQRQGSMVTAPDGRWAFAFLIGNGWMPHRGGEALSYLGQSIEHTAFPEMVVIASGGDRVTRLASRPNCSVCSGWLSGDTLTVLFGGYGDHANRILDRYGWEDGRYLGSTRLPEPALDVARVGDVTVVLEDGGLEPRIVGYRTVAPEPARR